MAPIIYRELICQLISIFVMICSCILHFCNHYQLRNCCCTKRKRFQNTNISHKRTASVRRSSILSSIQIYNNMHNNNCCCCQIDIMCEEILPQLSCIMSKDSDLQCYPLLFLFYLTFCTCVAISSIFITSNTSLSDIIFIYLIAISIIWELLFNYYRYYTTLHCVLTLANTDENCEFYSSIMLKFSIYATSFMASFIPLFIFQFESTIMQIIWFCLFTFVVLIHCISNSFFILSFSNILITQYESIRKMDANLVDIINDSMISSVLTMRKLSLCSITISTLYLIVLLLCSQYMDHYLIIILQYYPLCWCLLCFTFCLNFARNREWIKERTFNLKLKLNSICIINRRKNTKHQNNMSNISLSIKDIMQFELKEKHASFDHEEDALSDSQTLLTSSDTLPQNESKPKQTMLRKALSEYTTVRTTALEINEMPRSSSLHEHDKKRNVPFSVIMKQHKALKEKASLLQLNNEALTPSDSSLFRSTQLFSSRSAVDSRTKPKATNGANDFYKSYSLTDKKNNNRNTENISKRIKSMADVLILDAVLKEPQNIARAQTESVILSNPNSNKSNQSREEEEEEALQDLKNAFKASKSRSYDGQNTRYGIRSADYIRKKRVHHATSHNVFTYKAKRMKSNCKALQLLGISQNITTDSDESNYSSNYDEDDDDDDDDDDEGTYNFEEDDNDTVVWLDDDDDEEDEEEEERKDNKTMFFSNVEQSDEIVINIDMHQMSDRDEKYGDNDDDDDNKARAQQLHHGQLTPLQSLEMLQRNSINSSQGPKMSRAASYDLGMVENELKKRKSKSFQEAGMLTINYAAADRDYKYHHGHRRSMSDMREHNQLRKELRAINELHEENTSRNEQKDDMNDAVNLLYLMVKQGLYTSKNFNSVKQISKCTNDHYKTAGVL